MVSVNFTKEELDQVIYSLYSRIAAMHGRIVELWEDGTDEVTLSAYEITIENYQSLVEKLTILKGDQ